MRSMVSKTKKQVVMLVDDDADIRATIAEYLEINGLSVLQAGSGAECRKLVADHDIDLAILDLNLPDEGGLSLCRFLGDTTSMAIIMLTGAGADLVERVVGLEVGADDYLAKPFELREVLARARSALRRAEKSRKAFRDIALQGDEYTGTSDRVLLTILFTDIVGSTELVATLGDQSWFDKLKQFLDISEDKIITNGGIKIKSTGDGIMAAFDTPGRAIRSASAIQEKAKRLDLEIRAAIHTGECVVNGDDIAGVAVHVTARILGFADASEIVVSSTVKQLMTGSGVKFVERGEHRLKGLDDPWQLFLYQPAQP